MNFGIAGGYNVPPIVWMNERRIEFERAFKAFEMEKRGGGD